MIYRILDNSKQNDVEDLFTSAFSFSEGEKEGKLIASLSSRLASGIDDNEIMKRDMRKDSHLSDAGYDDLIFRFSSCD